MTVSEPLLREGLIRRRPRRETRDQHVVALIVGAEEVLDKPWARHRVWLTRLTRLVEHDANHYHRLLAGSGVLTPEAMSYALYHIDAIRSDQRQQWQEVLHAQGIQTEFIIRSPVIWFPRLPSWATEPVRFAPPSKRRTRCYRSRFPELTAEQC